MDLHSPWFGSHRKKHFKLDLSFTRLITKKSNMDNQYKFHQAVEKKKWIKKIVFLLVILFIICPITFFFTLFFISGPTNDFPTQKYFDIQKGMTVKEIGSFLEKEKIIKSALVFNWYNKVKELGGRYSSGPKAGKYIFKKELDVFEVHYRLRRGDSGIDPVRITLFEGLNNFEIANIIDESKKIVGFNKDKFLELASKDEGFLYPDTYDFLPFDTEEMIIEEMKDNFNKKTDEIVKKIKNSDKSLDKMMVMASLIEEEAGNALTWDKKEVSGVLWNRVRKGMLLQVDAVFSYIQKSHIPRVRYSHLKVDSPYNTYKNKGLPPTPIANPSVKTLEAALYPNTTDKLFYLTGLDGKFYYAKTYAQHLVNKKKYIDNYKK